MKFWHTYALIFYSSILLSACSTTNPNTLAVTIYTQPEGAILYEGSNALGMAPRQVGYQLTPNHKQSGVVNASSITAVWPSGAKETVSMQYQLNIGLSQYFTISRPMDAPGLEQDLAHAANLQARSANSKSNSDAGTALMLLNSAVEGFNSGYNKPSNKSYYPYPTQSNELRCTSRKIGNQVYTDCK